MRASKRLRNVRSDADHSVLQVISRPVVPADIKIDIARVVRTFEFSGADGERALHGPPSAMLH